MSALSDIVAQAATTVEAVGSLDENPDVQLLLDERAKAYATDTGNRAVVAFNTKSKKGLALALEDGLCHADAHSIAIFLLRMPGLDKKQIGEYLGDPSELSVATLREYVEATGSANFQRLGFDDALRMFLQGFRLPGEAAPIERCMEAFAATFTSAQPQLFEKEDTPFLLAYSTIMLNTDLHNPSQKNKMSKEDFVSRTRSAASDENLTAEYLETIYDRILHNEIQMNADAGSAGVDVSSVALYSKPRKQGYLTKKGHGALSRKKTYWVVLKAGALMLLDKPPALNAKPMLCLKMSLPSITITRAKDLAKSTSFTIVAPEGECIVATRFDERDEGSESVSIREYESYTFEAGSGSECSDWTAALLDEFGEPVEWERLEASNEQGESSGTRVVFRRLGSLGVKFSSEPSCATVDRVVDGSLAAQTGGCIRRGMVLRSIFTPKRAQVDTMQMTAKQALRELRDASHSRPLTLVFSNPQSPPCATAAQGEKDCEMAQQETGREGIKKTGPTEQADDLRPEEMDQMIAETRLGVAISSLSAAEYETAAVAFDAVLNFAPNEARRGLNEANKGIKLTEAASELAEVQNAFRNSCTVDSATEATESGNAATIEVQQVLKNRIGVAAQLDDDHEKLRSHRENAGLVEALAQAEERAGLHGEILQGVLTQMAALRREVASVRAENIQLRNALQ